MPSNSLVKFEFEVGRALQLCPPRQVKFETRNIGYHASVAAIIAAWDFYIKSVVSEHYTFLSTISDARFRQLSSIGRQHFEAVKKKYNTPNFDISREMLSTFIGYDPINDWGWPGRGLAWVLVQQQLNSIFRIRHSFAHGLPYPTCSLASGYSGVILKKNDVLFVDSLVRHLARATDKGVSSFIASSYGVAAPW